MGCFATGKLAGGDPAACLLNDASGVDAAISNQPGQCCIHTHKQSATQTRTWPRRCGGTTWQVGSTKTVMKGTRAGGGTQTSMCTENKTNLDRQVGVHPSAAALRVDRSESHCPPRWSLADTSTGWCPLLSHLHPRSHRQTHTHTRKQKATLASAFQAQGPENIINTLSNEDWHPAGWSGSSRHKALTCTLGLAHQRSVRTCACTVQSEVATGKMSSTSTDSFVDG